MKQKETQKEETSVKVKAQEEGIPQEKTAKERKEVAQFEGEQSETQGIEQEHRGMRN